MRVRYDEILPPFISIVRRFHRKGASFHGERGRAMRGLGGGVCRGWGGEGAPKAGLGADPHLGSRSLRAKGALISEPRFSTPCEIAIFPTREWGNGLFQRKTLDKGRSPFLAWEKSYLAGG